MQFSTTFQGSAYAIKFLRMKAFSLECLENVGNNTTWPVYSGIGIRPDFQELAMLSMMSNCGDLAYVWQCSISHIYVVIIIIITLKGRQGSHFTAESIQWFSSSWITLLSRVLGGRITKKLSFCQKPQWLSTSVCWCLAGVTEVLSGVA